MIVFRIAALALPLAAAFLAPALLAWRPGWKAATLGHAALCAPVLLLGLIAGAGIATLLGVLVLATAFAILASGIHLALGQVAAGLIACLLSASVFFAPQAVDDAIQKGQAAVISSRINFCFSMNPWAGVASSLLGMDVLHDFHSLYRAHLADYVDVRMPGWGELSAMYAILGIGIGGAGLSLRRRFGRSPA